MTTNHETARSAIAFIKWHDDAPNGLHHRTYDDLFNNRIQVIDDQFLVDNDEQMQAAIDAAGAGWDEDDLYQYSVEFWEAVLAALGDEPATA